MRQPGGKFRLVAMVVAAIADALVSSGCATTPKGPPPAYGGLSAGWQMLGHDRAHTGRSQFDTHSNHGELKWRFATSGLVDSSPVIGADGTIYVGNDDVEKFSNGQSASGGGNLYAINPDGTLKWKFPTGGNTLYCTPAIGVDGTIYIASTHDPGATFHDSYLLAVNPDGTLKWKFKTRWFPMLPLLFSPAINSAPTIATDGTIYLNDGYSDLYAIAPDGSEKWEFTTSGGSHVQKSSPAIGTDGTIYFGSGDHHLYAVNPDGTKRWAFETVGEVNDAPAIGADGTIYVGSREPWSWIARNMKGHLYAVNPDGTQKWDLAAGQSDSPLAIGDDGTIYIGSFDGIFAVNANGTLKWRIPIQGNGTPPAVGADRRIYFASNDFLYAIASDGSTIEWKFCSYSSSSPTIGADGIIYIGSDDGHLYALGPASPKPKTASKPKPAG